MKPDMKAYSMEAALGSYDFLGEGGVVCSHTQKILVPPLRLRGKILVPPVERTSPAHKYKMGQ